MPPILALSPRLLDQTFPRDRDELLQVSYALGQVVLTMEQRKADLVMTNDLNDFLVAFDWSRWDQHALMQEIYHLLSDLTLRPVWVKRLDLSTVNGYSVHPIPEGCQDQGLVDVWSDEVGRLAKAHDDNLNGDRGVFAAIACDSAFAGRPLNRYPPGSGPGLPLKGPDLGGLLDAYAWNVDPALRTQRVGFAQAKANCYLIGATEVRTPRRGSHYQVRFPNKMPWTLDANYDPVLEDHLKQLVDRTGLPLLVIKAALISGTMPEPVFRLAQFEI